MPTFHAVLALLALAAAVPAHPAPADEYPNRPVHLVFPYSAGGVSDLARLVAERLGERWRQPVLVEIRPGASGNVGAEVVARAGRRLHAADRAAAAAGDQPEPVRQARLRTCGLRAGDGGGVDAEPAGRDARAAGIEPARAA